MECIVLRVVFRRPEMPVSKSDSFCRFLESTTLQLYITPNKHLPIPPTNQQSNNTYPSNLYQISHRYRFYHIYSIIMYHQSKLKITAALLVLVLGRCITSAIANTNSNDFHVDWVTEDDTNNNNDIAVYKTKGLRNGSVVSKK